MNEVENKAIKYQIDFERYKNGEANKMVQFLDSANKEISKYIRQTSDVSTKKRYTEIARKVRDVSKSLKEKVGEATDLDGLIDYELKKQKSILSSVSKDVKGKPIEYLYPSREQIKTAALFKPADTKSSLTYQSFLEGIENGLYNTWDSALRTGYMTGMPTKEIVDFVIGKVENGVPKPGVVNALRNSMYANTRTVLQSFANETAQRVYEENEQYFGDGVSDYKYEYLATLDSRTCLVCGDCDGKLYKSLSDAPQIPQHRGCRCFIIPYFNIEGDTRASKDGQVSDRTTFEDWLKAQDKKTQKDVLGETRYEVFKKNGEISQFVDNGKVISLKTAKSHLEMPEVSYTEISKIYGNSKTIKEAKEELSRFAYDVRIPDNMDVETLNRSVKQLAYLSEKYPIEYMTINGAKRKKIDKYNI